MFKLITILGFFFVQSAVAATLHVAQWGMDDPGCGSANAPCESIGQAETNAGPNDRILVQPGIYTENVSLDQPGLRLESVAGNHGTVIEAEFGSQSVVSVAADKIRVGKKARGFTLRGGTGNFLAGIRVEPGVESGVRIEGNRIEDSYYGILARGDKTLVRYNLIVNTTSSAAVYCVECTRFQILKNRIRSSIAQGLLIEGSSGGLIRENRVFNTGGSGMSPAILIKDSIAQNSTNIKLRDNVVSGATGFALEVPASGSDGLEVRNNILAETGSGALLTNDASHAKGPVVRDNVAALIGSEPTVTGFTLSTSGITPAYQFSGNHAVSVSGYGVAISVNAATTGFKNNTTYASGTGNGVLVSPGGSLNFAKHFWGGTPEFDTNGGTDQHDALQATGATVSGTSTNKAGPIKTSRAAKL